MKGTDSKPKITVRTDKEGNFIGHESEIIKKLLSTSNNINEKEDCKFMLQNEKQKKCKHIFI